MLIFSEMCTDSCPAQLGWDRPFVRVIGGNRSVTSFCGSRINHCGHERAEESAPINGRTAPASVRILNIIFHIYAPLAKAAAIDLRGWRGNGIAFRPDCDRLERS